MSLDATTKSRPGPLRATGSDAGAASSGVHTNRGRTEKTELNGVGKGHAPIQQIEPTFLCLAVFSWPYRTDEDVCGGYHRGNDGSFREKDRALLRVGTGMRRRTAGWVRQSVGGTIRVVLVHKIESNITTVGSVQRQFRKHVSAAVFPANMPPPAHKTTTAAAHTSGLIAP